jgi:dihydroorotase
MSMDLVIEGNAFISGEIRKCCIGILDGKIRSIKKILQGDKNLDFGDKLILPAAIDAHVHFRDPGMTHKEDFTKGTSSAAFGGVTCVLDMPNTIPPTITIEALRDKARMTQTKSHIDFGLFAGVSQGSDIEALAKSATAFKIYMASTTGELRIEDYSSLPGILKRIGDVKKPVSIHCEDEKKLNKTASVDSLSAHLRSRPNEAEVSAIEFVTKNHNDAKVHICHVSSQEGARLVAASQFTSEVTPHHLLFNHDSHLGPRGKVNPPLRTEEDQFALWEALARGEIDIIASDHAPHTLEEKEEFSLAPSGMPGVETMLPIMLSFIKHNKFPLERLVNAISERPGEIFSINKGKIEEGYDADLIMVDMREEREIETKNLHSKCEWTAYEGYSAVFPKFTFLRGEVVIEDWEMTGEAGWGRMVNTLDES